MSTARAIAAAGRPRLLRPRLASVATRDAALLSIGTLGSGVLAWLFNVLSARTLGPETYGSVAALWASLFLLAVLLFRPVEQTVSVSVAERVAHDVDARPSVRSAARLALVVVVAVSALILAFWGPITDGLFGGRSALTAALLIGLAGYAASFIMRGLCSGVRWFGGYGLVLLGDGGIRLLLVLPLLVLPEPWIAAVAIAAAAIGGALLPLAFSRRSELRRIEGDVSADPATDRRTLRRTVRFAGPAAVIGGCEQVLVSGGPILVLIAGGPGAAKAAGVLFAATMLVRAPVFIFQGVAASLLPNLTTLRARGDEGALHRATLVVAGAIFALSVVLAVAAVTAGPWAMSLLYGSGFDAARGDLGLLALGVGAFLAASTFSQSMLAREENVRAAAMWLGGAIVFVTLELALPGADFHRVAIAFAAASGLVAALLFVSVWRARA